MAFSESDITLILMICLVVERVFKYAVKSCDDCSRRTKQCMCKSGCIEVMTRQKSDPDLDVGAEEPLDDTTPQLRAALDELNRRLDEVSRVKVALGDDSV